MPALTSEPMPAQPFARGPDRHPRRFRCRPVLLLRAWPLKSTSSLRVFGAYSLLADPQDPRRRSWG